MKKLLIVCFIGLFVSCSALANSIPSNDNAEQNLSDPSQMVFDTAINEAFLKNVKGNWTNIPSVVYTMTDDGYFFFTNQAGADGSFTLETNYRFYGALDDKKGIFITNNHKFPNDEPKYKGIIFSSRQNRLGIELKQYTNPKEVNSSGYVFYSRK